MNSGIVGRMPREFFQYPETWQLFELLEVAARRSAVSRAVVFEDFLEMSICALSGGRMEEQYLQVVAKHTAGKKGERGVDSLAALFAAAVNQMESDPADELKDVLGDLFQGAITYGEDGQYYTPSPIARMMAKLSLGDFERPTDRTPTVCDPASGSGRMLLAVAEESRQFEFVGQDIDLRCVKMTALNLGLRNLYGYAVHANSLSLQTHRAYRTGFDGRGFIKEIPLEACPAPVRQAIAKPTPTPSAKPDGDPKDGVPRTQLELF
ncbi:N-6 DNA methylase [Lignipirellula cremea]|uniref:site-specific DNA-methyltransferase (adenine-specific) n=1 Tax=Lignipirellula cremea TaxID=2528010 RepID=A0A518E3G4_9BACT|nr:N-6 DNA methylase [Lignipirellula cremea]QDU98612.1 N-6 DNA Methylase [Lignipirellula cremea]